MNTFFWNTDFNYGTPPVKTPNPAWATDFTFQPEYDLHETDSHYLLSLDMPGVSKNNVQIEVKDGTLKVSGERKGDRQQGTYVSEFRLSNKVESEKMEAVLKDGVLRLAIPKAESQKPRLIDVKDEDTSGVFKGLKSLN